MTDKNPKLDVAMAQLNEIDPNSALTLKAISDAQNGNIRGAIADLKAESEPHYPNRDINDNIIDSRKKAIAELERGNVADAIKNESDVLGMQVVSGSLKMLYDVDRVGPMDTFLGGFAGKEAVDGVRALNRDIGRIMDINNHDKTYDQQQFGAHLGQVGVQLVHAIENVTGNSLHVPGVSPDATVASADGPRRKVRQQ